MANFGPIATEIGSGVWGTPADFYFNGFRVLASLLHRCRSPQANQTLHDVWPSPGLVHYMYTFSGALVPWRNFARCKIHFTSKSCVLRYCSLHGTRAVGVSQTLRRGIFTQHGGNPVRHWAVELSSLIYFARSLAKYYAAFSLSK